LDVETSDALAQALREYEGTIIFVSHAQSFVKTLAHKILEIHGGRVREFMGDYAAYVQEIKEQAMEELEEDAQSKSKEPGKGAVAAAERREVHMAIRALQKIQVKRMDEIAKLEKQKSDIMLFFFENPLDYAPEKRIQLHSLVDQIAAIEKEWMRDENRVEELRASIT
jgi:ATP-binding cassette subfamily F protein 3